MITRQYKGFRFINDNTAITVLANKLTVCVVTPIIRRKV